MSIWKQLGQQGVWKSLQQQDVYISSYNATKLFTVTGTGLTDAGVVFLPFGEQPFILPSPSVTPTRTPSLTPTNSITPTKTPSVSKTPAATASPSKTPTPSITATNSVTPSITATNSVTPSITKTPSITPSSSVTPSSTPSSSVTPSKSIPATVTPSKSIPATVTPTKSIQATPSITPTKSIVATVSPSKSIPATVTPSKSIPPTPSITPSKSIPATVTPSLTSTPSITPTKSIPATVTPTKSIPATPSITPSKSIPATVTPSKSIPATRSVTPSITPSSSITPSNSKTPSITPTNSITPTRSPSKSISKTPSITPTNTITPTRSVTPTPSVAQHSITICTTNASWDNSVAGDTDATSACSAVVSGNYCYTVTLIKHPNNNGANAYPQIKDTIKEGGQVIQGGYYSISTNLGSGPDNYWFTYTGTGDGIVDTNLVLCSATSVTPTRTVTPTPTLTPTKSITPSNSIPATVTPTKSITPTPSRANFNIDVFTSVASWSRTKAADSSGGQACTVVGSSGHRYSLTLVKAVSNGGSNSYPQVGDQLRQSGVLLSSGGYFSYVDTSNTIGSGPTNVFFGYDATGTIQTAMTRCTDASPSPTPTRTITPSLTKTPSITPTKTPSNSIQPTKSLTPTRTPSPVALYSFDGGFSTVDADTACDQANGASPKTLKSTTQSFGTGTLQNGVSVIYDQFNNKVTNKFVSNGSKHGTTNANGIYSDVGLCDIA
tara:strand:- start:592 stop:2757 length:2166 start_codon:yes stop_codon:yes gene_type:complete